jgi:hypothetical protein
MIGETDDGTAKGSLTPAPKADTKPTAPPLPTLFDDTIEIPLAKLDAPLAKLNAPPAKLDAPLAKLNATLAELDATLTKLDASAASAMPAETHDATTRESLTPAVPDESLNSTSEKSDSPPTSTMPAETHDGTTRETLTSNPTPTGAAEPRSPVIQPPKSDNLPI